MKKIYSAFLFVLASVCATAATHNINISGFTYSPASISASVGDVIIIQADGTHPLVEVDQATWNANGNSPLASGFGTKTSTYTFTVTSGTQTIYYVCQSHAGMGMKGQINIAVSTGLDALTIPAGNLLLFPNPASDRFSVTYSSEEHAAASVSLYSYSGQEIGILVEDKASLEGTHTLQVALPAGVPAGIYFLEIKHSSGNFGKKLVVN